MQILIPFVGEGLRSRGGSRCGRIGAEGIFEEVHKAVAIVVEVGSPLGKGGLLREGGGLPLLERGEHGGGSRGGEDQVVDRVALGGSFPTAVETADPSALALRSGVICAGGLFTGIGEFIRRSVGVPRFARVVLFRRRLKPPIPVRSRYVRGSTSQAGSSLGSANGLAHSRALRPEGCLPPGYVRRSHASRSFAAWGLAIYYKWDLIGSAASIAFIVLFLAGVQWLGSLF